MSVKSSEPVREMQSILPHHLLNLTVMDLRARTIRIAVFAGEWAIRYERTSSCVPSARWKIARISRSSTTSRETSHRYRAQSPDRSSGLRSWLDFRFGCRERSREASALFTGSLSAQPRRCRSGASGRGSRRIDPLAPAARRRSARSGGVAERRERLEATVETLGRKLESRTRDGLSEFLHPGSRRCETSGGRRFGHHCSHHGQIRNRQGGNREPHHRESGRATKPFVAITCAALPSNCSSRSCSATRRVLLPTPSPPRSAESNRPPGARSSSMKSPR